MLTEGGNMGWTSSEGTEAISTLNLAQGLIEMENARCGR